MFKLLKDFLGRRWNRFRYVVYLDDKPDEPYLVRYRLLALKGFGVYLHHICRPDTDRNLHDHPFDFSSLILWGGYVEDFSEVDSKEVTARKRVWGSYQRYKAEDFHCVHTLKTKSVWTLVLRGTKRRDWGFRVQTRPDADPLYLQWEVYHGLRKFTEYTLEHNPECIDELRRRMEEEEPQPLEDSQ